MLYPLDIISIPDIRRYKQRHEAILDYYYEYYSYFQNERAKRIEDIKEAILSNTGSFEFSAWHRILDLQFMENPLSARGSVLNDPGGRFNIGNIDQLKFPSFPALYLAENYETAYREKNQILPDEKFDEGLSSDDLSLTDQNSTVDLLLRGHLKSVIDLSDKNSLKDFYNVIKDIKLSKQLEKKSQRLNLATMYHVKSYQELRKSILQDKWRQLPMLTDIPANSQIFGQLVHISQVEGIVYLSRMSASLKCLAVFPKNFVKSDSQIKIQDINKPKNIRFTELSSDTFHHMY